MTAANLVSYSAQIAGLVLACAAIPRVLALRSPGLQYLFWRVLLAVCLLLPIVEPWRIREMTAVAAPAVFAASAVPGRTTPATPDAVPSFAVFTSGAALVLLLGIAARLVWLGVGVIRLQRLRARAIGAAVAFADLQDTIGASATILWSDDVRQPVAFGIFRPIVLLPAALASADTAAQRAVVAHELHHVVRRDWAWVVAEEALRSIFWFHPAMWWLISRVQLARETVVDELSILTTNARRADLDALRAFADDAGLTPTPAFSARRHLFHRVMLLSKEENMSSSRIAVAACALVAALGSGAWGAVHAFPLSRTVTVSGTHGSSHDLNLPADQATPSQTRPTPGQLPPPPPPSPPRDTRPAPPPPPPQDIPESFRNALERLHPIRIGGDIKQPMKIRDVRPVYPDDAMAAKVMGVVIVEAIIDPDGTIADARIVRSVPMLDDAALSAVRQWKFTTTLLNGEPAAVIMTVTVNFTLQ